MIDPQQELFTELLLKLKAMEYDVYDTLLPPEDTPYPFIFLADSQQIDDRNKSAVFGDVYQTIHVWHNNPKQRGTVSKILLEIKQLCYELKKHGKLCLGHPRGGSADFAGYHNRDPAFTRGSGCAI